MPLRRSGRLKGTAAIEGDGRLYALPGTWVAALKYGSNRRKGGHTVDALVRFECCNVGKTMRFWTKLNEVNHQVECGQNQAKRCSCCSLAFWSWQHHVFTVDLTNEVMSKDSLESKGETHLWRNEGGAIITGLNKTLE